MFARSLSSPGPPPAPLSRSPLPSSPLTRSPPSPPLFPRSPLFFSSAGAGLVTGSVLSVTRRLPLPATVAASVLGFGAVTGIFAGVQEASRAARGQDSPLNSALGGCAAGAAVHLANGKSPLVGGMAYAAIAATGHWMYDAGAFPERGLRRILEDLDLLDRPDDGLAHPTAAQAAQAAADALAGKAPAQAPAPALAAARDLDPELVSAGAALRATADAERAEIKREEGGKRRPWTFIGLVRSEEDPFFDDPRSGARGAEEAGQSGRADSAADLAATPPADASHGTAKRRWWWPFGRRGAAAEEGGEAGPLGPARGAPAGPVDRPADAPAPAPAATPPGPEKSSLDAFLERWLNIKRMSEEEWAERAVRKREEQKRKFEEAMARSEAGARLKREARERAAREREEREAEAGGEDGGGPQ